MRTLTVLLMRTFKGKTIGTLAFFMLVLAMPWTVAAADNDGLWDLRFFNNDSELMEMARHAVEYSLSSSTESVSAGFDVAGVLKRLSVPLPARTALTKAGGGLVMRADRAAVMIPPTALPHDLEVTVAQPSSLDEGTRRAKQAEARLAPASLPVAFGPEGTVFSAPVTITLPYDLGVIRAQGLKESALKIHYWNSRLQRWEDLPSTVDGTAQTVSALVLHFSVYQVLGAGGGIGVAAADASFGFKAVYAFPNPVRGANTATIRVQPGLADSVEVSVYDLSGRKVHSSSDFRLNPALDDGNGLGPQFTYDHVWDVSGIGSGVYTYAVVARKAGQADIRKTGKLGIVK